MYSFTCGRCGGEVAKSAARCRHCGVRLDGIRCQCGFAGSATDFPGSRCPKCGCAVRSAGSSAVPPCPACGADRIREACRSCEYRGTSGMELWGAVGAAGLLGALIASVATLAEAKSDSDVLIGLAVALVLFGGGGAAAGFGVLPHLLANSRAYDAARKAKGPRRPPDGQPE